MYDDGPVQDRIVSAAQKDYKTDERLKAIKAEMQFFAGHSVRRCNQIEFSVCEDSDCNHCPTVEPKAKKLLQILRQNGGIMPTPTLSTENPGHYMTLLEILSQPRIVSRIDEGLPSLKGRVVLCDQGCNHVMFTEAERKRHRWIVHKDI